jgi:hypothetical protein
MENTFELKTLVIIGKTKQKSFVDRNWQIDQLHDKQMVEQKSIIKK